LRAQKSAIKSPAEDSELVAHLKRKLADMNIEKEKLRNEMFGMAQALDAKENAVRSL
jgi:hypothetical protein